MLSKLVLLSILLTNYSSCELQQDYLNVLSNTSNFMQKRDNINNEEYGILLSLNR